MQKGLKNIVQTTFASLLAGALIAAAPVQAQEGKPIRLGWTAWSDAEVVTKMAQQVLEERLGYDVELILADIGLQYQGVAKGDMDVMLTVWLPLTHQAYWEKFSDQVVDIGVIYGGAKLGWVVPTYVPESELNSIEDLTKPEVKDKLKSTIQGIDPGAGLMQASETVLTEYGLEDYTLLSASDAAMTAAIDRAVRRDEWIVATAWNPHWMFASWDLRYLEDPKGVLGGGEEVHGIVRAGFEEDYPQAAAFLFNYKLDLAELETIMLEATKTSSEEAAAAYLEAHPELIDEWVKPALDKPKFGS